MDTGPRSGGLRQVAKYVRAIGKEEGQIPRLPGGAGASMSGSSVVPRGAGPGLDGDVGKYVRNIGSRRDLGLPVADGPSYPRLGPRVGGLPCGEGPRTSG